MGCEVMLKLSIEDIVKAVKGSIYVDGLEYNYSSIETDTRKIKENSLFIALVGENFNGNEFVLEAAKKGSKICIASQICFNKEELPNNTTIIKVEDTKKALLDLAEFYRSKLTTKIVGITGSTGKTSTKDILAAFLGEKFNVFKTKGNFNNEIGLPLMVFNLDNSVDVAVLEMGMNNLGEIHNLAKVARPEVALITNVGISHIENLKTRENILKAKMEITDFFKEDNFLIVNNDNDMLNTLKEDSFKFITTGIDSNSNVVAKDIELLHDSVQFRVIYNGTDEGIVKLPMVGIHNVSNALLCYAACRTLGVSPEEIKCGANNIEATSMRLDIVKMDNFTILDDCYNASPDSMKAALEVEKTIEGKRRVAILGTMRELGDESKKAHEEVGKCAKDNNVDLLIAVGEFAQEYKSGFNCDDKIKTFDNTEEVRNNLKDIIKEGDVVLVKASRSLKFESIVKELKELNK